LTTRHSLETNLRTLTHRSEGRLWFWGLRSEYRRRNSCHILQ